MEKMYIYLEGLDLGTADGVAFNEIPRVQTGEGIVSYQSKMYQTLLDQGNASRRNREVSGRGLRDVRLWGPNSRVNTQKRPQK